MTNKKKYVTYIIMSEDVVDNDKNKYRANHSFLVIFALIVGALIMIVHVQKKILTKLQLTLPFLL